MHFVLSVSESTALPFCQIIAWLALKPKLAKFSFKFSLPRLGLWVYVITIFSFSIFTRSKLLNRRRCLQILGKLFFINSFFVYVWKVRSFFWIWMRGCCSCFRGIIFQINVIFLLLWSDEALNSEFRISNSLVTEIIYLISKIRCAQFSLVPLEGKTWWAETW